MAVCRCPNCHTRRAVRNAPTAAQLLAERRAWEAMRSDDEYSVLAEREHQINTEAETDARAEHEHAVGNDHWEESAHG